MKSGVSVNANEAIEHEADVMGARVMADVTQAPMKKINPDPNSLVNRFKSQTLMQAPPNEFSQQLPASSHNASGVLQYKIEKDKLNLVGEDHDESGKIRAIEYQFLRKFYGFDRRDIWLESSFITTSSKEGDSWRLRAAYDAATVIGCWDIAKGYYDKQKFKVFKGWVNLVANNALELHLDNKKMSPEDARGVEEEKQYSVYETVAKPLLEKAEAVVDAHDNDLPKLVEELDKLVGYLKEVKGPTKKAASLFRSLHMLATALNYKGKPGVWKIGDDHLQDIKRLKGTGDLTNVTLTTMFDFQRDIKRKQSI